MNLAGRQQGGTKAAARAAAQEAGFSVLELMIALAIFGFLIAQVSIGVVAQDRTYRSYQRSLATLDTTRLGIDLISSDTRNAGFMVPRWAAIAAVDGGANGSDRLCVSDLSYFDLPAPGSAATTALDLRTDRFPGSSVSVLASSIVAVSSLDIDDFGSGSDFSIGGGVIIAQSDGAPNPAFPAKGIATHCARIAGINQTVSPPTLTLVTGHEVPGGVFTGTTNVIAVPANVYEINGGLWRNGILLSSQLEDLQVELWVDSVGAPNGVEDAPTEFPIHDLNQMPLAIRDSARIRRVQLTLIGRSATAEMLTPGILRRPASANRVAGPNDGFSRKTLQVSLLPRNLLDPEAYANVP